MFGTGRWLALFNQKMDHGSFAPIWVVLLAQFLTKDEKLTPYRLLEAILDFAGVVVMIGPDALAGIGANVLEQLAVVGLGLL